MARVTVEDCIKIVENRFELVELASQRARKISSGAPLTIDRDNDKNAVVALREIAAGTVIPSALREAVISNLQRKGRADDAETEPKSDAEKEDHLEIEAELSDYEFEDLPSSNTTITDDISFEEDNFDVDE